MAKRSRIDVQLGRSTLHDEIIAGFLKSDNEDSDEGETSTFENQFVQQLRECPQPEAFNDELNADNVSNNAGVLSESEDEDDESEEDEEEETPEYSRDEMIYVLAVMVIFHNVGRNLLAMIIEVFRLKAKFHITKADVYKLCKTLLNPHQLTTVKLCSACASDTCDHPKLVTLTTANILPQLRTIYKSNSDVLNEMILTINTDGVCPKNHKTQEFWPLFLQVQNLPYYRRGLRKNSIFAGLLSGEGNPSSTLLERAQRHLLDCLPHHLLSVVVRGVRSVINVILRHGIFDNPAYCKCWTLSSHNSRKPSCRACLALPKYIANAQRYNLFKSSDESRRTPHAIEAGIERETVMSRLLPLTAVRMDFLHVLEEGILSMILKMLFTRDPYNPQFYLGQFGQDLLDAYSQSNGRIASSERKHKKRLNLLCGHEKRFVFCDLLPACCNYLYNMSPETQEGATLLSAFWLVVRSLCSSSDPEEVTAAADTLEKLGKPFQRVFGDRFRTMKTHLLFVHGADELREHGNFMAFSAATFEAFNNDVQKFINPANSKGFHQDLIARHLLFTSLTKFFTDRPNSRRFQSFVDGFMNTGNDYTAVPKKRLGTLEQVLNEVKQKFPSAEYCRHPWRVTSKTTHKASQTRFYRGERHCLSSSDCQLSFACCNYCPVVM